MGNDEDDKRRVNPGYAWAQLDRALAASNDTRAAKWRQVLAGLESGALAVGSRSPAGTPAWVTLEVLHGGFATGNLAAGGALLPHEVELLRSVPHQDPPRLALNLHFLADAGRAELAARLADGRYRVHVPEEGALLVAAWLLAHDEAGRAAALLDELAPFFDRLRFYPTPHPAAPRERDAVSVETAGQTVARLRARRPRAQVVRMNEALAVWTPLYDRAVALFLETVEDGWPCRLYASGWGARARQLLADHEAARAAHGLCGKPERPKENYARLRGYLEICVDDPARLGGRDVGMIRRILASFVERHGAPDSPRRHATRAMQAQVAARPLHAALAARLADALAPFPPDEGVPAVDDVLAPLAASTPPRLVARAARCLEAPLDTLVERALVGSGEALARLLADVSARVRAGAIADRELRRLYEAIYVAFRRRRSLLLLTLEGQVKLGELPWIAAIAPWTGADAAARNAARETLTQAARLTIGAFPQAIIPNKLVTELAALASDAGLELPLVAELAADIFRGSFAVSFVRAAQVAARQLRGTLYERYYGLPYDRVLALHDREPFSRELAALCTELAASEKAVRHTVRNGTILEQAQLLTTHNLAVLFEALPLAGALDRTALAMRSFEWICGRLRRLPADRRARLRMVKNCAYAWRQMIFYLSRLAPGEIDAFVRWAEGAAAPPRLAPAIAGLAAAARGERVEEGGGRRFLGWSVGPHWLLLD